MMRSDLVHLVIEVQTPEIQHEVSFSMIQNLKIASNDGLIIPNLKKVCSHCSDFAKFVVKYWSLQKPRF